MKGETKNEIIKKAEKFAEGVDYYFENGLMVLTKHFLLKRGFCCENKCRNCPYEIEKGQNYNRKVSNS